MSHTLPRLLLSALLALLLLLPVAGARAEPEPGPPAALEELLAPLTRDRVFRSSEVGVHIARADSGETVFARNAEQPLVPASTMKVVTAAAALDRLGPSYRFTTELLVDGPVDGAGVLQGNLYVRGTGDPTMVLEELWRLVYDLRIEGVQHIAGDVVFDESFFGESHELVGWDKPEDIQRGPSYFPKLSALSLNFNTIALVVSPGPEVGGPARAWLETEVGNLVEVDSDLTTAAAGAGRSVRIERVVDGARMTLAVVGQVPQGSRTERYYRTVPDPTAYFMAAFWKMEQRHGIELEGRHRLGSTPRSADLLVQHRSPPLAAILMDMNKYSNNFMAEQVLRALGAEVHGLPGTTDKGLRVVSELLDELGAPVEPGMLINGSGLSRRSRLKPTHLTTVMRHMDQHPQVGAEFVSSLAIGGLDGTLWRRLRDEPGKLRGKTGTLDGVHCLTGYVDSADDTRYVFAFLVNGIDGGIARARRLQDRFLRELVAAGAEEIAVAGGEP